jgi:lysyl-tRNA synthetase class I
LPDVPTSSPDAGYWVPSMKIWITQYALSIGIIERNNAEKGFGGTVLAELRLTDNWRSRFHPTEFSLSLADAQAVAEQMRQKRIASLEKQLAKVRTMEIKVRP